MHGVAEASCLCHARPFFILLLDAQADAAAAAAAAGDIEHDGLLADVVAIHFGQWGALKAFQVCEVQCVLDDRQGCKDVGVTQLQLCHSKRQLSSPAFAVFSLSILSHWGFHTSPAAKLP